MQCQVNTSLDSAIFSGQTLSLQAGNISWHFQQHHPYIEYHRTEGHDAEISGAIFGCLLLEQVATFGEYFCRFLRPAVAGRRKEKFYHHHNSKVLRSIFGLVSVMALILRLLPLPSLKGHNSAP